MIRHHSRAKARYAGASIALLLGFLAFTLSATIVRAQHSAVDSIEAQSRAFSAAYERGDVDAMMAIYADDGVVFPGNMEMIQGQEDLRSYWALGPAASITHHEATPTEIRVEGDMASDYGVYEIAGSRGGEAWGPFLGKYLIVWERGADGMWRMQLDMWNARSREVQPEIDCVEMAAQSTIHVSCVEEIDLVEHFEGMEGTFVVYDAHTGQARVYNRSRARERFLPASTFKIPNSIIALESGAATGADFTIEWDSVAAPPQDWWPKSWRGDQTLRSALRNSVVWYYQELARRMGMETIQGYVDRFAYGNRELGDEVDRFWLRGPLAISPYEQVGVLDRFLKNKLGISDRTTAVVRDMLVLEEGDGYVLSGKTGTADPGLAWLVGYVELDSGTHVYALNMEGDRVWEDWPPAVRLELVKTLLGEVGVLPGTAD